MFLALGVLMIIDEELYDEFCMDNKKLLVDFAK